MTLVMIRQWLGRMRSLVESNDSVKGTSNFDIDFLNGFNGSMKEVVNV